MTGNPFFIQPVDVSQQLAGLGKVLGNVQERKQKQQRLDEYKTLIEGASTPDDYAAIAAQFPEHANAMKLMMDVDAKKRDMDREDMADVYRAAYFSDNPAVVIEDFIAQNPDKPLEAWMPDLGMALENPDQFKQMIGVAWASTDPKGWEALQKQQEAEREAEKYETEQDWKQKEFDLKVKEHRRKMDELAQKESEGETVSNSELNAVTDDLRAITKEAGGISQSYRDLEALKSSNSPTDQLAAVFKFMKALDPTSVVRETEQGMVYEASGAAAGLAAKLTSLMGEGGLGETTFADIVETSKTLADESVKTARQSGTKFLNVYGDRLDPQTRSALEKMLPEEIVRAYPAPSQAAIEKLKNDPSLKAAFINRYGEEAYLGAMQ